MLMPEKWEALPFLARSSLKPRRRTHEIICNIRTLKFDYQIPHPQNPPTALVHTQFRKFVVLGKANNSLHPMCHPD